MIELPDLTILLGPQTRLALTLNTLVRVERGAMKQAGLTALPNRVATRLLRQGLDGTDILAERQKTLKEVAVSPAFLSAVNFLGPPAAAFIKSELFPDAEAVLGGLRELTGPAAARVVTSIDVLHRFFLDADSDPAQRRVRNTRWEVLYELSWADLVTEIHAAMPDAEIVVLTPRAAAVQSRDVLTLLFGRAAETLPDPYALARIALTPTGHATLDRLLSAGPVGSERLEELIAAFPETPDEETLSNELGMDSLTVDLMEQRFREDLRVIETIDRVRLL